MQIDKDDTCSIDETEALNRWHDQTPVAKRLSGTNVRVEIQEKKETNRNNTSGVFLLL